MKKKQFGHAVFWPAAMLLLAQGATAEPLKKPELDALLAAPSLKSASDFPRFAAAAAELNPSLRPAVDAYLRKRPLGGDDLVDVARLLGVYNRARNEALVIDSLGQLVALPTVRDPKVPQHENPAIIEMGKLIERMAREAGLEYRNVDNRIFEVKLRGTGPEEFGILTHTDVVPATRSDWVLDDGTQLDPFKMQRVGGLLYGRGTTDDKGSIATVLYAMGTVKQSGLAVARTMRLMIETTEETGGDAFEYYRGKNPLPEYNIVLDSGYPAVIAEKGAGALKVYFPLENPAAPNAVDATAITQFIGAPAANVIPLTATARLRGGDTAAVAAKLEGSKSAFIQKIQAQQAGAFTIDIANAGDALEVKVTGLSAHGSQPENGVNPVPRLAMFLGASGVPWADNHYAKAVRYLSDVFGTDYLGEKQGWAYKDDFMGPLTLSPTYLREAAGQLEVVANVRMPRGRSPAELKAATTTKIDEWARAQGITLRIQHDQGDWMARDPNGAWLTTLLNIFGDTTGLPSQPRASAGATTAKQVPNAINFGPSMPGKKYTGHTAKEFREVADLQADMQMFTEMLVRIGNLKEMR